MAFFYKRAIYIFHNNESKCCLLIFISTCVRGVPNSMFTIRRSSIDDWSYYYYYYQEAWVIYLHDLSKNPYIPCKTLRYMISSKRCKKFVFILPTISSTPELIFATTCWGKLSTLFSKFQVTRSSVFGSDRTPDVLSTSGIDT